MENFVLLYHFDKQEKQQQFEQSLKKEFPKHREDHSNGLKYFGFSEKAEPGAVDKVSTILTTMGMGREGFYGLNDFVALYFTRDKEPDVVKRQLLIGTKEMVDPGAEDNTNDAHRSSIKRLLEYNYQQA
ncbi:hypothetical protein [Pontibacter rugosus]|uniref:Uncharacterized protein n=1 Tax=Pontibacter rugosus TaxID=1745966 RepID=A0ABW3SWV2_9BACT